MALGKRIRHYRLKLGWTLDQLSERSDVEVGTISALEQRDSQRSQYAQKIAKALGLTVDELLDESRDYLDSSRLRLVMSAAEPAPTYRGGAGWPFPNIDARKLSQLDRDDLLRLEGAVLSLAISLGVDVRKEAAA